jgi:hypothetical protein
MCNHSFLYQANVNIDGIIYDIYYCTKCLKHVKQERPCPIEMEEIKLKNAQNSTRV